MHAVSQDAGNDSVSPLIKRMLEEGSEARGTLEDTATDRKFSCS
jgi:hypothetical protein